MPKTKINVKESIRIMDNSLDKLEQGFINADLTKEEADDITKQLEDVIALAEQIKTDIATDKIEEKKA